MKIVLDEGDFRDLVAGKVIRPDHPRLAIDNMTLEIALSDIGWDRMLDAMAVAMVEREVSVDVLRKILRPRFPTASDCDDDGN
jgi:hypothetical protein